MTSKVGWNRPRGKYGAKKVEYDGYSFASQLEGALYMQLKLELMGKIWDSIECQPEVLLSAAQIIYKPDFRTKAPDGTVVFHEAKGFQTPEWRIKRRLWKAYGPGELRVYMGNARRIVMTESIIPKGNEE